MADLIYKKQKLLSRAVLALFCVVAIFYITAVGLAGGSLAGFALYAVAFALLVALPGVFLCRVLLPTLSALALPVVAVGMGSTVLILSFVLFGSLGAFWGTYILPLGLSCYFALQCIKGKKVGKAKIAMLTPQACAGLLLFTGILFLLVFSGVFASAWPSAVGGAVYNQDALWGVGSAGSAWYGFPIVDLRTAGGIFHYHYFSDVVAGLAAVFSGQHTWDVNFFFLRPLWPALLLLGCYAVARNFGASVWQAFICPVGVGLGMFRNYAAVLYTFSNPNNVTQSYIYMFSAVLVLQHAQKEGFANKKHIPAILLTLVAALWSKGSVGLLFLIGLCAAWAVYAFLQKRFYPYLAAGLVLGLVAAALLMGLLFSGANINVYTEISLVRTREVLTGIVRENAPLLLFYLVALVHALRRFTSLSFMELALHAVAFGGIMANCIFNHYGGADTYFMLVSLFVMWLCLAPALPNIFADKRKGAAAVAVVAFCVVCNMLTLLPILRHGVQAGMRCIGIRPPFEAVYETLTPSDEAAALWLREHMSADDVFATNRNERDLQNRDGVFQGYTALSGRQAYVEGWFYAMEYSMEYTQLRHNLEGVSDVIFACETYDEAAALARENGITYLLLHLPTKGVPFEGGEPVFVTDTVLIYRV